MDISLFQNATEELKKYNSEFNSNKVMAEFFSNKSTKNLIANIKKNEKISIVYQSKRGKGGNTLMHPELFAAFKNWLYKIPSSGFTRDEIEFASFVQACFEGVLSFEFQKRFDNYFVDLYCDKLRLCIEYDEAHHRKQKTADIERQAIIESKFGVQFIRHQEGRPIYETINTILKMVHSELYSAGVK